MPDSILTSIKKQLITILASGIVSAIIVVAFWFLSGAYERIRTEVAKFVIAQISFEVKKSEIVMQTVTFQCEPLDRLVSASCVAIDSGGYQQVAVGPVFNEDRSFACHSYGSVPNRVQATAICYKISGQ